MRAHHIDRVAARHLPTILRIVLEQGQRLRRALTRGVNLYFLDMLLSPAFAEMQPPRLPTPFAEPDDYPPLFREWVRELAAMYGGYQTDWTEYPEARRTYQDTLKAPSVEALTSGEFVVRLPVSQRPIPAEKFREWVAQGADSVAELATDAASLVRDTRAFGETTFHAWADGKGWSEDDLDREVRDRIGRLREHLLLHDPLVEWEAKGQAILDQIDKLATDRQITLRQAERAVQKALQQPSAQERGMAFRAPMSPLAMAQAAWLYEHMLFGEFNDGLTLLEQAEIMLS